MRDGITFSLSKADRETVERHNGRAFEPAKACFASPRIVLLGGDGLGTLGHHVCDGQIEDLRLPLARTLHARETSMGLS